MPRKNIPDDCMPRCETCVFIQREQGADVGYCRRHPPQVVVIADEDCSVYPVIEIQDWCGEFQRRTN